MNITKKTVLITGGSAGIGLEIAKLFSQKGNQVIITGRDEKRLQQALTQLKNTKAIVSDVSKEDDVNKLAEKLKLEFPQLDIVINNAGRAFTYNLAESIHTFEKAGDEMLTNYLSIIRLNEKLLPLLRKQQESAIVNVSSVVAFAPGEILATYSASKAALHSYTQSLRLALEDTPVKVFELMPPLVDTEFSREIGGSKGIHPSVVAEDLLKAMEIDEYEIHVGQTAYIYQLSLSSPADALAAMNSHRRQVQEK